MQLADILRSVHIKSVSGSLETEIDSLCHDSRRAGEGALFFALPGVKTDGSGFIGQAVEAGAAAVVSEKPYPAESSVPWIQVTDARRAMARFDAQQLGFRAAILHQGNAAHARRAILLSHATVDRRAKAA